MKPNEQTKLIASSCHIAKGEIEHILNNTNKLTRSEEDSLELAWDTLDDIEMDNQYKEGE